MDLTSCPLFAGLPEEEIPTALACLSTRRQPFKKDDIIFFEGDPLKEVGIILSGSVQIFRDDFYGNRTVIGQFGAPQLFAEAFACAHVKEIPVSVMAVVDSEILFIETESIFCSDNENSKYHNLLINNLLTMVAKRNLMLNQKLRYISKKTTRDRLMEYLMDMAKETESDSFYIPFDRQALADYLGVERSAMSTELGKLVKDGIIETKKNYFKLL